MNSRDKGKRGELEFAALLREHGYAEARRGQQFRGGGDSPDVVGVAGIHHEVKRVEKLNLDNACEQAANDAPAGTDWVVAHRKNRGPWYFTMNKQLYFRLLKTAGYV